MSDESATNGETTGKSESGTDYVAWIVGHAEWGWKALSVFLIAGFPFIVDLNDLPDTIASVLVTALVAGTATLWYNWFSLTDSTIARIQARGVESWSGHRQTALSFCLIAFVALMVVSGGSGGGGGSPGPAAAPGSANDSAEVAGAATQTNTPTTTATPTATPTATATATETKTLTTTATPTATKTEPNPTMTTQAQTVETVGVDPAARQAGVQAGDPPDLYLELIHTEYKDTTAELYPLMSSEGDGIEAEHRSFATSSDDLSAEIGEVAAAYAKTVEEYETREADVGELDVTVMTFSGEEAGTYRIEKEWAAAYNNGEMSNEEYVTRIINTVETTE